MPHIGRTRVRNAEAVNNKNYLRFLLDENKLPTPQT